MVQPPIRGIHEPSSTSAFSLKLNAKGRVQPEYKQSASTLAEGSKLIAVLSKQPETKASPHRSRIVAAESSVLGTS